MSMLAPCQTLAAVFIDNRAQLRRIAQGIVRSTETADDIVQDAWLRIADAERLRNVERPFCYCCQVVRNLALDHCRRQALEATYRIFDIEVEHLDQPTHATPQKLLLDAEILAAIEHNLSKLPTRTRQAYELSRTRGMTQRQIAVQLGCSLGLVNAMLADAARAIEACRDLLVD